MASPCDEVNLPSPYLAKVVSDTTSKEKEGWFKRAMRTVISEAMADPKQEAIDLAMETFSDLPLTQKISVGASALAHAIKTMLKDLYDKACEYFSYVKDAFEKMALSIAAVFQSIGNYLTEKFENLAGFLRATEKVQPNVQDKFIFASEEAALRRLNAVKQGLSATKEYDRACNENIVESTIKFLEIKRALLQETIDSATAGPNLKYQHLLSLRKIDKMIADYRELKEDFVANGPDVAVAPTVWYYGFWDAICSCFAFVSDSLDSVLHSKESWFTTAATFTGKLSSFFRLRFEVSRTAFWNDFKRFSNWIYRFFTGTDYFHDIQVKADVDDLFAELAVLAAEAGKFDTPPLSTVTKIKSKYESLKLLIPTVMRQNPSDSAHYHRLLQNMEGLVLNFVSAASSRKRKKPVSIFLYGAPGVQKGRTLTALSEHVPILLRRYLLQNRKDVSKDMIEYVEALCDSPKVYNEMGTCEKPEFDDGYNHPLFYIVQELASSTESTINITWMLYWFRMVDSDPFLLNMAGLGAKGNQYMNAPFVAATTNAINPTTFMDNPQALYRRMDFPFQVFRRAGAPVRGTPQECCVYRLSPQSVDIFGDEHLRPHNIFAEYLDLPQPVNEHTEITYNQLLYAVVKLFIDRLNDNPACVAELDLFDFSTEKFRDTMPYAKPSSLEHFRAFKVSEPIRGKDIIQRFKDGYKSMLYGMTLDHMKFENFIQTCKKKFIEMYHAARGEIERGIVEFRNVTHQALHKIAEGRQVLVDLFHRLHAACLDFSYDFKKFIYGDLEPEKEEKIILAASFCPTDSYLPLFLDACTIDDILSKAMSLKADTVDSDDDFRYSTQPESSSSEESSYSSIMAQVDASVAEELRIAEERERKGKGKEKESDPNPFVANGPKGNSTADKKAVDLFETLVHLYQRDTHRHPHVTDCHAEVFRSMALVKKLILDEWPTVRGVPRNIPTSETVLIRYATYYQQLFHFMRIFYKSPSVEKKTLKQEANWCRNRIVLLYVGALEILEYYVNAKLTHAMLLEETIPQRGDPTLIRHYEQLSSYQMKIMASRGSILSRGPYGRTIAEMRSIIKFWKLLDEKRAIRKDKNVRRNNARLRRKRARYAELQLAKKMSMNTSSSESKFARFSDENAYNVFYKESEWYTIEDDRLEEYYDQLAWKLELRQEEEDRRREEEEFDRHERSHGNARLLRGHDDSHEQDENQDDYYAQARIDLVKVAFGELIPVYIKRERCDPVLLQELMQQLQDCQSKQGSIIQRVFWTNDVFHSVYPFQCAPDTFTNELWYDWARIQDLRTQKSPVKFIYPVYKFESDIRKFILPSKFIENFIRKYPDDAYPSICLGLVTADKIFKGRYDDADDYDRNLIFACILTQLYRRLAGRADSLKPLDEFLDDDAFVVSKEHAVHIVSFFMNQDFAIKMRNFGISTYEAGEAVVDSLTHIKRPSLTFFEAVSAFLVVGAFSLILGGVISAAVSYYNKYAGATASQKEYLQTLRDLEEPSFKTDLERRLYLKEKRTFIAALEDDPMRVVSLSPEIETFLEEFHCAAQSITPKHAKQIQKMKATKPLSKFKAEHKLNSVELPEEEVVLEAPEPVYEAQSAQTDAILKKIKRNMYAVFCEQEILYGSLTFMGGRIAELNKHVWKALPSKFQLVPYDATGYPHSFIPVVEKSKCTVLFEQEIGDLVIVSFGTYLHSHPYIAKYVLDKDNLKEKISLHECSIITFDTSALQGTIESVSSAFVYTDKTEKKFLLPGSSEMCVLRQRASYHWSNAKAATCGSLLVAIVRGSLRIIAIHAAATVSALPSCLATIVLRETFDQFYNLENPAGLNPNMQCGENVCLEDVDHVANVFSVDPSSGYYVSPVKTSATNSTTQVETPFKEFKFRGGTNGAPTRLGIQAYKNARERELASEKFLHYSPELVDIFQEDPELDIIGDYFFKGTPEELGLINIEPASAEAAIYGHDGLDGFDFSTADGPRMKHLGIKKGCLREPESPNAKKVLAMTQDFFDKIETHEAPLQINFDCLKDEITTVERRENHHTRLFCVTDPIDNFVLKMIMFRLMMFMKLHVLSSVSCCGINPLTRAWEAVASEFDGFESIVFTDVKGFDHIATSWLYYPMARFFSRICGGYYTKMYHRCMYAFIACVEALRFNGGFGRRNNRGGSSGNACTTLFNTFINFCLFSVIIYLNCKNLGKDFKKVMTFFRIKLYSDDNVSALRYSWWTNKFVALEFARLFHATLTDVSKVPLTAESPDLVWSFDDVEFLSRKFRRCDGVTYAPLSLESILGQLYYLRLPKNRRSQNDFWMQLQENLDNVCRECVELPEDVARSLVTDLIDFIIRFKLPLKVNVASVFPQKKHKFLYY